MQRAAVLAGGPEIDLDVLFPGTAPVAPPGSTPATRFEKYDHEELARVRAAALEDVDRRFVTGLLEQTDGNVSEAARRSGVNRTYLQKIMGRLKHDR
jgi:DNA-binding NtrC family response regulator